MLKDYVSELNLIEHFVIFNPVAYFDAGTDVVGAVPATAEDPAGRAVLRAVAARFSRG